MNDYFGDPVLEEDSGFGDDMSDMPEPDDMDDMPMDDMMK